MSDAARIPVVVLAAGASSRFEGDDKLLARVAEATVLEQTLRAVEAHASGREVMVVVRTFDEARAQLARERGMRPLVAADAARGMRWSIAAGLAAVDASAPGAVIVLGDDPLAATALDAVLEAAAADPSRAACVDRGSAAPHPVYLPRGSWPDPPAADDDSGLRSVIAVDALRVPVPGAPSIDVDTIDDLRRLQRANPS